MTVAVTLSTADLLALAREDLGAYAAAVWPRFEFPPHLQALADRLEAIAAGLSRRLLVSMPPRHGKSLLTSPKCRISDDSAAADKFNTAASGIYVATGRGGHLVGRGADLLQLWSSQPGRHRIAVTRQPCASTSAQRTVQRKILSLGSLRAILS